MPTGKIVSYSADASSGIIECQGERYYFNLTQWMTMGTAPEKNMTVSFDESEGNARNVRLDDGAG